MTLVIYVALGVALGIVLAVVLLLHWQKIVGVALFVGVAAVVLAALTFGGTYLYDLYQAKVTARAEKDREMDESIARSRAMQACRPAYDAVQAQAVATDGRMPPEVAKAGSAYVECINRKVAEWRAAQKGKP